MLVLEIAGSEGDIYKATFERTGDSLRALCTCPAGEMGTHCKHRLAVLNGDFSRVAGDSDVDIAQEVASLIQGTGIERAMRALAEAEQRLAAANAEVKRHKAALGRLMNQGVTHSEAVPSEPAPTEAAPPETAITRARRSEVLNVEFVGGLAKGWTFGVVDAFRPQLDIRLDDRVDKEGEAEKRKQLGRPLKHDERVFRRVWTQGDPPAYGFERGHVFHFPAECHLQTPKVGRPKTVKTIIVLEARADAGALSPNVGGEGAAVAKTTQPEIAHTGGGWVDYELFEYDESGRPVSVLKSSLTQTAFVQLLRTGQ